MTRRQNIRETRSRRFRSFLKWGLALSSILFLLGSAYFIKKVDNNIDKIIWKKERVINDQGRTIVELKKKLDNQQKELITLKRSIDNNDGLSRKIAEVSEENRELKDYIAELENQYKKCDEILICVARCQKQRDKECCEIVWDYFDIERPNPEQGLNRNFRRIE